MLTNPDAWGTLAAVCMHMPRRVHISKRELEDVGAKDVPLRRCLLECAAVTLTRLHSWAQTYEPEHTEPVAARN